MPLDQYAANLHFRSAGNDVNAVSIRRKPGCRASRPRSAMSTLGKMLRGTVHDPTAHQMGGVAGDAGVFSNADDVAKFAQALLNGGAPMLSPLIVEKMTTPQQPPNLSNVRGLGWDIDSPFSSNRGELLPVGSFGHTGFTGTSLWIDPTTNTYIILLTNAVHLKEGNVIALRTEVATAVAAALQLNPSEEQKMRLARITGYNEAAMASAPHRGSQWQGAERDRRAGGAAFRAARRFPTCPTLAVGLVTNQTGIDSQGQAHYRRTGASSRSAADRHLQSRTWRAGHRRHHRHRQLERRGTGVPIYSVYGDTDAKRRPPPDVITQARRAGVRSSRMLARASTLTRPRWDISWKPRPRRRSRLSCSTAPIQLPALTFKVRSRMPGRKVL